VSRTSLPLLSFLILLAGCATQAGAGFDDESDATADATDLALSPPERGLQLASRALRVEPGEDIRWCEVVQLPGGPRDRLHVDRLELAASPEVRDLIVSAAVPGSATEAAMLPGSRVPCTRAGEAYGEHLAELVSSQEPYLDQRYPAGVGQVLQGGQKIALDYHVVGDDREAHAAQLALNLHAVDPQLVTQVARTASFQNLTLYTPPGGRSSHLAECSVTQPLVVQQLVRRTQTRGTGFRVWIAGGMRDGELVWQSASPSDARVSLPRPLALGPGEGLRFQCDFVNDTDLELRYGVNASDEQCALSAVYVLPMYAPQAEPEGCLLVDVDADGVARK
jgi:hypothetical protein